MNLAEIRKKSESKKKGESTVGSERPEIAEELFEGQQYDFETDSEEPETFVDEVREDELANCAIGVAVEEDASDEDPLTEFTPELFSDAGLPEYFPQKATLDEETPSMPDDITPLNQTPPPFSFRIKSAGYDPMTTIISGRECSSDSDEASLYSTLPSSSVLIEEYLCFKVAKEEYAINIMAIKEIIKPRDVTEVPRMPGFISGVISLRGVIIPIMDMRLRLALTLGGSTGRERVIVVKKDSGYCGILVDEVVQVARINNTDIEDPPAVLDGIDRDFVKGLGRFEKRMLILLNLDSILDICIN